MSLDSAFFRVYLYGINAFSLLCIFGKTKSLRLLVVVLLELRELKWSWPVALAISFPDLVFLSLFAVPW
jgi:hypothetical protein